MSKFWVIVIVIVALAILIGAPVGLYFLGDDESSALEKLRDVAIVLMVLIGIVMALLMTFLVAALAWLAIIIKDKLVPVLESLNETAGKVKETTSEVSTQVVGTTQFVTENVAKPMITAYGLVAQAREFTRVVTGRDKKGPDKTVRKIVQR